MALGGEAETVAGLCGLGDLVLTCSSPQSRNMSVGLALGRGETLEQALAGKLSVAEGVASAPAVRAAGRASSASRRRSARPWPPSWPARSASTTPSAACSPGRCARKTEMPLFVLTCLDKPNALDAAHGAARGAPGLCPRPQLDELKLGGPFLDDERRHGRLAADHRRRRPAPPPRPSAPATPTPRPASGERRHHGRSGSRLASSEPDNPARPAPGVRLCALADIADPGGKGFRFRDGARLFAGFVIREGDAAAGYVDSCPHAGWPLAALDDRYLTRDGRHILCAGHGALFRLDGPASPAPARRASSHAWPVEVRGGEVFTA